MDMFDEACDLPPDRQVDFLRERCGGDESLLDEVRKLLRHDAQPIGFVAEKAHGGGFEMIAPELAAGNDAALPGQVGSYRILDKIGEGGKGVVYRAEQQRPRRIVALKLIRFAQTDPSTLRRFEHEAELLARLSHPGIAQVYEAGVADLGQGAQPFIAMEFVQGLNLLEFVRQRDFGVRQKLELMARVCDAVQHAHQRGVIHRDLKPANILVVENDQPDSSLGSSVERTSDSGSAKPGDDFRFSGTERGRSSSASDGRSSAAARPSPSSSSSSGRAGQYPLPKILDFGVARAADADVAATMHTSAGQIIGTLAYMSPEQVRGDVAAVDTRTDVYALGAVLYQVLAGRVPLMVSGVAMGEALRMIREDAPPLLGSFEGALRGDVETIVAKALEKDRERRYASASELAADLRRHLSDEPIVARPATRVYALRKFAARHKALVGAGACVVILSSATFYLVNRARLEAGEQREAAMQAGSDAERSRANEVTQRGVAERKAKLSQTMLEFIANDVLAQASPRLQPKRDITLRETLDRAAGLVPERFAGDPEAEAYLQYMLGATYESLGELERGEELLRRAYELRVETLGAEDLATLNAQLHLALTVVARGRHDEAVTLLQEAVGTLEHAHGSDHDSTLRALRSLAMLHRMRGNVKEAAPLYEKLLETLIQKHGEAHAEVVMTLSALGVLQHQQGGLQQALATATRAMKLAQQVHGRQHQRTIDVTSHVASLHRVNGETDQAIQLARQAYDDAVEALGMDHQTTSESGNSLALAYAEVGRLDEAEDVLRAGVEAAERSRGADHLETLAALDNLANCMLRGKKFVEAVPIMERVLAGRTRVHGAEHVDTLFTRDSLALALFGAGRQQEAIVLEEKSVELHRRSLAPGHPLALATLKHLGTHFAESGQFSQAEATFAECLRLHREHRPANFAGTAEALVQHAECLALIQDWERAEAEMLEAFEIFAGGGGDGGTSSGCRRVAGSLATLYEATNRPEDAKQWRQRASGS